MSINYIQLTPSIKIPKGNFAPLYDITGNRDLFERCHHAEILSADDLEQCFTELRKTLEVMAIDLEVSYCMETHQTGAGPAAAAVLASSAPSSPSRQALANAVNSDMQNYQLDPRVTVKSLIRSALDRRRHEDLSSFRHIIKHITNKIFKVTCTVTH